MKSELTVRTQGVQGGNAKVEDKGCVTIFVTDKGQTRSDLVIDIDSFVGSGVSYQRREKTLINISYEQKMLFAGTIEQLVAKLSKKPKLETTSSFEAKGLVYGFLRSGQLGAYPTKTIVAGTREELLKLAGEKLQDGSIDAGMGFESLEGALLNITETTAVKIDGKVFYNENIEQEFIGNLTEEEKDFLSDTDFGI